MNTKALLLAVLCITALFQSVNANCNATELDSGISPYIDNDSTFLKDTFTLIVGIPVSFYNTNFTFVGSNSNCLGNSGWTVRWQSSDANCTVLMQKAFSWENMHANCGPSREDTSDRVNFKLAIKVDGNQDFVAGQGADDQQVSFTRSVSNILGFTVSFPKFIRVLSNSTSVTNVLSGDRVPGQSVLTSVKVNSTGVVSTVSLDLEVATIVTYPDYINGAYIVSTPVNVSATMDSSAYTQNCGDIQGKNCLQYWRIRATLSGYRCDFNGDYTIFFPYLCKASYAGACPNANMTVTIKIQTLNHCPSVTTASLSADMFTYKDNQYSVLSSNYKLRDTVYGEITSKSDTATIQSTNWVSIVMTQPGYDNVPMVSNGALSSNGSYAGCIIKNSADLTSTGNNSTRARFQCRLMPAHIILAALASRSVTWIATVEIVYAYTSSTGSATVQRRLLSFSGEHQASHINSQATASSAQTTASALNRVINPDIDDTDSDVEDVYNDLNLSSASTLSLSFTTMMMATLVSILMAMVFTA